MKRDEELATLRDQLAGVALKAARELLGDKPDMDRVAELDDRAAGLRARIRELAPLRAEEEPDRPMWLSRPYGCP